MRTLRRHSGKIMVAVTAVAAALCIGFNPLVLVERGGRFFDMVEAMLPLDTGYLPSVLPPLLATLEMSVEGTVLGAVLGLLGACGLNSWVNRSPLLRFLGKAVIQLVRTVPVLILALLLTFLLGLGTLAGTVALTVYTFAVLTRLGYEDMESGSRREARVLEAAGATRFAAFRRTILVRTLPGYLNNALYLWEANVRNAAILGFVGAGGIGLLLNERLAWREYSQVGAILLLLYLLVICAETVSEKLRGWLRRPGSGSAGCKGALLAVLAAVLGLSLWQLPPVDGGAGSRAAEAMVRGILSPDWSLFSPDSLVNVPALLVETLCIAWLGTLAGAVIAFVLSFLASFRIFPKPVAGFFRLVLLLVRTVPILVYGLLWIRVAGPGPGAGVLTLMVCSVGLLAKRFLITIDRVRMEPYLAYRAMGCGFFRAFWYGVRPQLVPGYVAAVFYRLDVNLREASILGLVGAGGIGTPLVLAISQYRWQETGAILAGLVVLVGLAGTLSEWLRKRQRAM